MNADRRRTDSESLLTDKRLKQSTLEDTHNAFYGEAQRPVVWLRQSAVIFFQQFERPVSF